MDVDTDLDAVIADAYALRDVLYEWYLREKSDISKPPLMGGECKTFFDVFIVFVLVCILLYVLTMVLAGAASATTMVTAATIKIQSLFSSIAPIANIGENVGDILNQIVLAKKHVDILSLTPLTAAGRLVSSYVTILITNGATRYIESHSMYKSNKDVGKSVVKFVKKKAFTLITLTVGSAGVYTEYSAFLTVMNLVCSLFPSTFWKKAPPKAKKPMPSNVSESNSDSSDPREVVRDSILSNLIPREMMRKRRGFFPVSKRLLQ